MVYAFHEYELDEGRRELRRQGVTVPLQPLVLELLLYLARNRDRAVPKDELMEAIWPDAIVGDGSLQRLVSLARAALRDGSAAEAIRTHARYGYRFVAAVTDIEEARIPLAASAANGARFAARGYEASADDEVTRLESHELERWAYAAYWAGRGRDVVGPLEKAVNAHVAAGRRIAAARGAVVLAYIHWELAEAAPAKGQLRWAASLAGDEASREKGLIEWMFCRVALAEGRLDDALEHAEASLEIGRRIGDLDVEALGLVYRGMTLVTMGKVEAGMALQDEAGAIGLGGPISPWIAGVIYCAILWTCRSRCDWQRAAQWSDSYNRWCDESGLKGLPGVCSLHHAEVLTSRGDLQQAETELMDACEHLPETSPWAVGDVYRVLGEIQLVRCDLEAAEPFFLKSIEVGWDPQPGYAMLLLAQGKPEAAIRGLERGLEDMGWANRLRRGLLLSYLVMVSAQAGDLEKAASAIAELEANPDLACTPALAAARERALAEVALAEGRREDAVRRLRRAAAAYAEAGALVEVASARLRLAEVLILDGEGDSAADDIRAAEASFRRLGIQARIEICRQLAERAATGSDDQSALSSSIS